ncbi:hypothetical protein SprV_0100333200 [Sparganum proliferum]
MVYTCPYCDRTFTSHVGPVGHLRVDPTKTGEPVPRAPAYTRRSRLHCPHCPRIFMHRISLFGHERIHESGIDRDLNPPNTSNTPTIPNPAPTLSPCASTAIIIVAATDTANSPVYTVPAHSPHVSTLSVTCESIVRRLANQCLEHQHTLAASASTVHIALAHSRTE